jgi:hypothetical protein
LSANSLRTDDTFIVFGALGVGTNSPTSNLHVMGAIGTAVATLSGAGTFTLDQAHSFVRADATNGNITIQLPAASGVTGRQYMIKRADNIGYTVTIDPNGSETIDGNLTYPLNTQYKYVIIVSNGSNWEIVANN